MTAILAIEQNGQYVDMPTPSTYSSIAQEITESNRTVEGDLVKTRIAVKMQLNLSWKMLSPEGHLSLIQATEPNGINIRYFDTNSHSFKYGKFYRGNDLKDDPIEKLSRAWDGEKFQAYTTSMSLTEF